MNYTFILALLTSLDIIFFFFSSRRRHTRYIGDWSSDVCSSDLWPLPRLAALTLTNPCVPSLRSISISSPSIRSPVAARRGSGQSSRVNGRPSREIGRASCRKREGSAVVGRDQKTKKVEYKAGGV